MLTHLRSALKYLLQGDIPSRRHDVWPDDIFLVSFPKSGNTWTRFLIGNLMNPDKSVGFANIERIVPDISVCPQGDLRQLRRPRVIKSHECFDPRYRRVIYIVRDPRDVAVSLYHYAKKVKNIDDSVPLEVFVKRMFVPGRSYNGTWGEHVGSWLVNPSNIAEFNSRNSDARPRSAGSVDMNTEGLGARGHERNFLLVRYEDLLQDTSAWLQRIAEFSGLNATAERIERAVERSSADSMRKLESSQNLQWVTTRETRKDIHFVREAKSGQWRTALSEISIAEIESAWGHLMKLVGYKRALIG